MYLLGRAILLLLLLSACKHKQPVVDALPVVTESPKIWKQGEKVIIIAKDDNWWSLEKKFEVPVSVLKRFNHTKKLQVGKKLKIPAKNIYQVKMGDTALSIVMKYSLTLSELTSINNLNPPYDLKEKKKLKVIDMGIDKSPIASEEQKFIWPIKGNVVEGFNNELVIDADGEVNASASGVVVYIGEEVGKYNNLIIIKHSGNWFSSYANLNEIEVKEGNIVKAGQKIGYIKNHYLYFGLKDETNSVNPIKYLPKIKQSLERKSDE